MDQSVDEEVLDLMEKRMSCAMCLAHGDRNADNDVSEQCRLNIGESALAEGEREHIGRFVFAAILSVQRAHGAVADEQNAQFRIRKADTTEQGSELAPYASRWQAFFPLIVFYPDIHRVFCLPGDPCRDSRSGGERSRSG